MRVGVTGHRPDKLWGYGVNAKVNENKLKEWLKAKLVELETTEGITGMALGVDTIFARAVIELKDAGYSIRLVCAIPCLNHTCKWVNMRNYNEVINEYNYILSRADEVVIVSNCEYNNSVMQIRNEWMVDHSDIMIAVWDGSRGGTGNCVRYINTWKKPMIHVRPFIFN